VDAPLTRGIAREQPLRDSHLFQIMPLAGSLRLPLGFQTVPELLIVFPAVGAQHEAAGAQAPGEGVEANGLLPFRSFRAAGVLGILPIGLLLFG
jgi:hypothetical protein